MRFDFPGVMLTALARGDSVNYIADLIRAGQALLYLARQLDAEGKVEEASKLYGLAFRQGLLIRHLKQDAALNCQAGFVSLPTELSLGL